MLKRLDVADVLAAETRRSRNAQRVRLVIVALVVVVLAAGAFWGWSAWQTRAVPAYLTDAATRGELTVTLVATGTIAPSRQVAVSSLVAGTVASVDVDYNQPVTRGQALAHLDPRDLAARLARAEAMVDAQSASRDAARTAVTDAQAALARARQLPEGQVISKREVELATTALRRATANLNVSEAQLRAALADLDSAQSDYAKATITSPIDGVVLEVNAEIGQTVSAAMVASPLFLLADDLRMLEAEVDIAEADIPQVKAGDAVSFTVESAPDRAVSGTIIQVRQSPRVTDGVTSYAAVIAVDNTAGTLRPGMTVTATIVTARAVDVLSVANGALRYAPAGAAPLPAGGQRVHVLRDGAPVAVPVTTGLTDGQRTEIVSGELAAGDIVVTGLRSP